ncbi:hypothetical protein NQZ68_011336 [Dissostichus eleginoides]|nr:hypothetical protein NQZ68_011336 [Dissostichus eleginoides]
MHGFSFSYNDLEKEIYSYLPVVDIRLTRWFEMRCDQCRCQMRAGDSGDTGRNSAEFSVAHSLALNLEAVFNSL